MKNNQSIRKLYSKTTLAILVVVILLLTKATWSVYQKEYQSRRNVDMVKQELKNLQKRKSLLEVQNASLSTVEGQEKAIREKYQVSKEGENLIVVVDKPLPQPSDDKNKHFFSKVWKSVSGIFKNHEEDTQ